MAQDKRIIFLGTPEISAVVLEGLVKAGFNIVGVVTKEDKIRGRNNLVEPSPVALKANELGIPVHKPHKLNLDYQFLMDKKPDLLLTFAYGQLISDAILALPTFRPLNLHASLLPKYRGAAPIQYALRNGEKETGVSLMQMVHAMDAGDVFAVKKLPILDSDNYSRLADKLALTALDLAKESLPLFFANKLKGVPQNESEATFCPSIKKEEEKLLLSQPVESFINQVRSLSYVPGGYLLNGDEIIKIYSARKVSDSTTLPVGSLFLISKKQLGLQLTSGQVEILELQRPGKKRMMSSDFLNGVKDVSPMVLH